MVTSLDDGMNLVAKEYVICTQEDKGVLMLSQFAGATTELSSAITINPYDTEESAEKLYQALTMSKEEKQTRNIHMKKILKKNNIYKWGESFIQHTLMGKM
jgi:trehalose-6-phosphate synthase